MVDVSVLMATRNGERYVRNAINSILNQTFTNFELVICNDHSSDSTQQILEEFANADSRIKVIRNTGRGGLMRSLNLGLNVCQGKFIARMDDDDVSHNDRLQVEVEFLNSHPDINLVGTNVDVYDKDGVYGHIKKVAYPSSTDIWRGNVFVHPTVMFRKSMVDVIGGYDEQKSVLRIEDYDYWCRAYACGFKGANLQCSLLDYREDSGSFKKRDAMQKVRLVRCMSKWRKALGVAPYFLVFELYELFKIIVPERLIQIYHKTKYDN